MGDETESLAKLRGELLHLQRKAGKLCRTLEGSESGRLAASLLEDITALAPATAVHDGTYPVVDAPPFREGM